MSSDEEPDNGVFIHHSDCPIVVRYSSRPVTPNFLEADRKVPGIVEPQAVLLDS